MSIFNREEQLKFIEDVKNNPEKYKPTGTQIYSSPNGIGYWMTRNKVCPECGSNNGFFKVIGNRNDKGWNECIECGWMGNRDDTLTHEEYLKSLNQKRFEKLNQILL